MTVVPFLRGAAALRARATKSQRKKEIWEREDPLINPYHQVRPS